MFPEQTAETTIVQRQKSYYIITRAPECGCVATATSTDTIEDIMTHPTCNDSEVLPIKRYLPTFSPATGYLYKNPQCAYCHGVHIWKQHATCPLAKPYSNDCNFYFTYTGNYEDLDHLECFTETFSACPVGISADDLKIPPGTDLSSEDVRQACLLEYLPRFRHNQYFAKNVFCYICRYCKITVPCEFKDCPTTSNDPEERFLTNAIFLRTIHTGIVAQDQATTVARSEKKDSICTGEAGEQVCHEILCPLGQVKTGRGGKVRCEMDSSRWATGRFNLLIHLNFEETLNADTTDFEAMFNSDPIRNPWADSWKVKGFYKPMYRNITMTTIGRYRFNITSSQTVDSFSHAYVEMSHIGNRVDPQQFISNIEKTLTKFWLLMRNDGTKIRTRQSISRDTVVRVQALVKQAQIVMSMPRWQVALDVEAHERFLYKRIGGIQFGVVGFVISKLMLCHQVELDANGSDVMTYTSRDVALYYNESGKYLFGNEFTRVLDADGEDLFRVF